MRRAALGFRMHSGWGVLVAVHGSPESVEVIDRRRIETTNGNLTNQPYHHAAQLTLRDAERYLEQYSADSECLALAAVQEVVQTLEAQRFKVSGAAVLTASGRALPALEKILASHPLIHTAEGEFFRHVVKNACEHLKIPVTAFPERTLDEHAQAVFGKAAERIRQRIATLGPSIGPPWTKDHKNAALAAAMLLARD